MRQYALLDHLLAFKQIPLRTLGLSTEQVKTLPRAQLAALPLVQAELAAAQTQLRRYRPALERVHGPVLRHHTQAVVGLGMVRLVWESN